MRIKRPLTDHPVVRRLIECLLVLMALLSLAITPISVNAADGERPAAPDTVVATLSDSVVALAASVRQSERLGEKNFDAGSYLQAVFNTYELATRNNDARAYGHTLQLLQQWPSAQPMPDTARLIKAAALQHSHHFDAAAAELAHIPAQSPARHSAAQMLAQISLTAGHYDAAIKACDELRDRGAALLALNCQTQIDGLTGDANHALTQLRTLLAQDSLAPAMRLEFLLTAADIANRLAMNEQAQQYYQAALQLAPDNNYLIISYSDWLMRESNPGAVLALLADRFDPESDFEQLILYALALRESGQQSAFDKYAQRLNTALSAMHQRGDDRPHKLIAQHALYIANDYALAVQAAKANWQIQKEPSDLLLLVKAGNAAQDSAALDIARSWLAETGTEYVYLQTLLEPKQGVSL